MKILCFMNHADKGGAALAFIELIEHLSQDYGVKCIVYTGKKNEINRRCGLISIENHWAPFRNFISAYHKPTAIWKILFAIRHVIGNFIALRKIKHEIDIHSIDLVYTNLDRIDIGAILSKKYNIPHVWHLREHLDTDFNVISVYRNYVKYMMRFNSYYVAVSDSVKCKWVSRGLSFNDVWVVYDGVNTEEISTKNNWFQSGKINFLFMGGYCDEKGQLEFLRSLSKLPKEYLDKISVTFFGSGSDRVIAQLVSFCESNNMGSYVQFNQYRQDIYKEIKNYDVGINYSIDEGFGRVTVEYMAAGLCVLCSNCGANPELVTNMYDGVLVDRCNRNELEKKLIDIIDSPCAIVEYGKAAQNNAKKFSMEKHTENMYLLFKNVIWRK